MHAAALFETMGDVKAREFFAGLRVNGVKMLSSNGEVKRRVAAGEFAFGLTDTDDVHESMKDGKPVAAIYPDADGAGTLVMPNAAVLVAGAPHAENGRRFDRFSSHCTGRGGTGAKRRTNAAAHWRSRAARREARG